jgi:hypothetical protein
MTRSLQVEDVTALMQQARSVGADPVGVIRLIFQGLGDDVLVTGEVLRAAIAQSGFSLPVEAGDILGAVACITKSGEQVKVELNSQVETVTMGTPIRLGPEVTHLLQYFPDGMALADITGVAVNKFMWLDIQRVQFRDGAGRWTMRVDTNFGGQEFPLG